ncbi:unnamed protein product [Paramecium sonneborni]|uniref:Uncharacterized protein n=1 Tax=Paramecium sonneborni TaxID=65129 RepID=A0A8S1RRI7_9CILI|nr:unnamed protein product [Paramecium sonneborni]
MFCNLLRRLLGNVNIIEYMKYIHICVHFRGGGLYDQGGCQKKIGIWGVLYENFEYGRPVIYRGEYNANGTKVGRWDIIKFNRYMRELQIGCINFDENGNAIYKSEFFVGSYKNSLKVGRWHFIYNGEKMQIIICIRKIIFIYFSIYFSGGGSYDQEGNQIKIKSGWNWMNSLVQIQMKQVDFWCFGFQLGYQLNKIQLIINFIFFGKIINPGLWTKQFFQIYSSFCKFRRNKQIMNIQISGGSYDQKGNLKRLESGQIWMKSLTIRKKSLILVNIIKMYKGQQMGHMYCEQRKEKYQQMYAPLSIQKNVMSIKYMCVFRGGGSYDQEGNCKKIGKWVELDEEFSSAKQITYNGQYNKKGMKVGAWIEMDLRIIKQEEKRNMKIEKSIQILILHQYLNVLQFANYNCCLSSHTGLPFINFCLSSQMKKLSINFQSFQQILKKIKKKKLSTSNIG